MNNPPLPYSLLLLCVMPAERGNQQSPQRCPKYTRESLVISKVAKALFLQVVVKVSIKRNI